MCSPCASASFNFANPIATPFTGASIASPFISNFASPINASIASPSISNFASPIHASIAAPIPTIPHPFINSIAAPISNLPFPFNFNKIATAPFAAPISTCGSPCGINSFAHAF
ncbi:unnamed protein product [Brachionus calyciflorus]|uniref:Uncharacterized protein n=1 Tax=Brachionus calyciflorus TaxID=104777 RepID=A0A814FI04_9BILA|nr:unnamed protein product [Brachionus calyciflorus]